MNDLEAPTIVRREATYRPIPGVHSRNSSRLLAGRKRSPVVRTLLALLLIIGLCGTGYYLYALADQQIYQAYENWAFDKQISGQRTVTFSDYLRERTPFGFLAGEKKAAVVVNPNVPPATGLPRPAEGDLLGRVAIPRLNLSAIVREGVDERTLSLAVGHVPSTALPGQAGNFAIAAHRDTLFRALKDIKRDDVITFQAPGGTYSYRVDATKIVKPSDVSVLRPDGGGLINLEKSDISKGAPKLLTMITCYPFYYVGSAPKRFIVQARLVSDKQNAEHTADADNMDTGSTFVSVPVPVQSSSVSQPGSPRLVPRVVHPKRTVGGDRSTRFSGWDRSSRNPPKRPGFWHRIFHAH